MLIMLITILLIVNLIIKLSLSHVVAITVITKLHHRHQHQILRVIIVMNMIIFFRDDAISRIRSGVILNNSECSPGHHDQPTR